MDKQYDENTYRPQRTAILEAMQRQEHALGAKDAALYERATQQLCKAQHDMRVAIARDSLGAVKAEVGG